MRAALPCTTTSTPRPMAPRPAPPSSASSFYPPNDAATYRDLLLFEECPRWRSDVTRRTQVRVPPALRSRARLDLSLLSLSLCTSAAACRVSLASQQLLHTVRVPIFQVDRLISLRGCPVSPRSFECCLVFSPATSPLLSSLVCTPHACSSGLECRRRTLLRDRIHHASPSRAVLVDSQRLKLGISAWAACVHIPDGLVAHFGRVFALSIALIDRDSI